MTGSCWQAWSASLHLLLWSFKTQHFHCAVLVFPVAQFLRGEDTRDQGFLDFWASSDHMGSSDLIHPSTFLGNSHLGCHRAHFTCMESPKTVQWGSLLTSFARCWGWSVFHLIGAGNLLPQMLLICKHLVDQLVIRSQALPRCYSWGI